jgi:hypothetical protein
MQNNQHNPIKHIGREETLDYQSLSRATRQLESRLVELENMVVSGQTVATSGNKYLRDKLVASGVVEGDWVYYDEDSGNYNKALAQSGVDAATLEVYPTANVVGLVVTASGQTADILVDGVVGYEDITPSLQQGEVFRKGIPYYLSKTEPGKVTQYPPEIAVQLFVGSDSEIVVSRNYSQDSGYQAVTHHVVGARPVGGFRQVGTSVAFTGFQGLINQGGDVWASTKDTGPFQTEGVVVAEGTALAPMIPVWVELQFKSGNINVRTADTLATLDSNFTTIGAVGSGDFTHQVLQEGIVVYQIDFKLVDHTLLGDEVRVLLRVPESFQGWRDLSDNTHRILTYGGYFGTQNVPAAPAVWYYALKSDLDLYQQWPPAVHTSSEFTVNGVKMSTTTLKPEGANATFENPLADVGVSQQTFHWLTQNAPTLPWDLSWKSLKALPEDREEARLPYLDSSGENWYWYEHTYTYEQYRNDLSLSLNKVSTSSRNNKVLTLAAVGNLKLTDSISGRTASDGEPITGHLVLSEISRNEVVQRQNLVDIGSLGSTRVFSNTTTGNMIVQDIVMYVTSQTLDLVTPGTVGFGTTTSGEKRGNIILSAQTELTTVGKFTKWSDFRGAPVLNPGDSVYVTVDLPASSSQFVTIITRGRLL